MKRKSGGSREELSAQTALRLPPDMLDKLRKAAGSTRGLGEEIRRRLEATFDRERIDPKARQLLDAIDRLAAHSLLETVWCEDAFAFEVFKTGVNTLLLEFQPESSAAVPKAEAIRKFGDVTRETLGQLLAMATREPDANETADDRERRVKRFVEPVIPPAKRE